MELQGKSVMVTGGAGFIGSHIVDRLLRESVELVTVYDNFSTGRMLNLEHLKYCERVRVIHDDIMDKQALRRAMSGVDVVFHQAAQLEILKSIQSPQEDAIINIIGTLNVLETATDAGVEKLVSASSAGCYGQARYVPQDENHPLEPQWSYGVSKLSAEKYCLQFYQLYGLKTVVLRYAIVYGEREWYRRVMTVFLKQVMEGQAPVVFGNGQQTRDFVHVSDVAIANIQVAKSDVVCGQALNIGSGVATSINQLASTIIELMGKAECLEAKYENPSTYEKGRKPEELQDMHLDVTKAETLLGWRPTISLENGLTRYICWLHENKDKYWGSIA